MARQNSRPALSNWKTETQFAVASGYCFQETNRILRVGGKETSIYWDDSTPAAGGSVQEREQRMKQLTGFAHCSLPAGTTPGLRYGILDTKNRTLRCRFIGT
jgi:hypothetical protein